MRRLVPLWVAARALAFSGGAPGNSGMTGKTCNDCHSGGLAPKSVTISGPTALAGGDTATYLITIASADSPKQWFAGVDVAPVDASG